MTTTAVVSAADTPAVPIGTTMTIDGVTAADMAGIPTGTMMTGGATVGTGADTRDMAAAITVISVVTVQALHHTSGMALLPTDMAIASRTEGFRLYRTGQ